MRKRLPHDPRRRHPSGRGIADHRRPELDSKPGQERRHLPPPDSGRHPLAIQATIARIRRTPPGFTGVSVRTRRVRPRFRPRRIAANSRGPLSPGGRAGRAGHARAERRPGNAASRTDPTARPAAAPRRPGPRQALAYHDGIAPSLPTIRPRLRYHQTDRDRHAPRIDRPRLGESTRSTGAGPGRSSRSPAPVGAIRSVRHRGPRRRDQQGAVAGGASCPPPASPATRPGRRALRGPGFHVARERTQHRPRPGLLFGATSAHPANPEVPAGLH